MSLPSSYQPLRLRFLNTQFRTTEDDKFISLNDLESSDELDTLDSLLVAMILYYKISDGGNKISVYSKGKKQEYASYSRMVTLMCLKAQAGRNCFSILVGKQRNAGIFDSFLSGRDSGSFSPGAIVCIYRPQCIGNWLGRASGHPLLDMPGSFLLVDQVQSQLAPPLPHRLLQVCAVESSERLHAYLLPSVSLRLLNIHFIHSNCGGNLCGSLEMYNADGYSASSCACFHAIQRVGNILMMVTVEVSNGSSKFIVKNFTSRAFTNLFIVNGVPTGLTATMLNENHDFVRHYIRNVRRAFQVVNDGGKFWLAGWIRKGYMNDEGLSNVTKDGSAAALSSTKVKSSESTYHIAAIGMNDHGDVFPRTDLSGVFVEANDAAAVNNDAVNNNNNNNNNNNGGDGA